MNAREIVERVASSYTSKTRCVLPYGSCRYFRENGRMCAVGMFLQYPKAAKSVVAEVDCLHIHLGAECLDELLVPEVRGLPIGFWCMLQRLHDKEGNWGPHGLNEPGRAAADEIIACYTKENE